MRVGLAAVAMILVPAPTMAQGVSDPALALDALHATAARADALAYFDRLGPDLTWTGNDTWRAI